MNIKQLSILLVLAIAIVSLSGCICCCNTAGGTTDNPTVTATAKVSAVAQVAATAGPGSTPQSATSAPGIIKPTTTQTPAGPKTVGAVFDIEKFRSIEYRTSTTGSDKAGATFTMENLGITTYNGVQARHMHLVVNQIAEGREYEIDLDMYNDPSTGKTLGGHMKVMMGDQVFMEQDMTPVTLEHAEVPVTPSGRDTPLTMIGPEKVTIDGKTYDCIKYSCVDEDGTSYYWLAPGVPAPVKFETQDGDNKSIAELISWS